MSDVKPVNLPSDQNSTGRSFGTEELELLRKVIDSGTLNCTKGTVVRELEARFAKNVGAASCRTTTSGTAAIHAAVASVDPEPGDEIITTPITDMGGITPILYQTAIPVFADCDPLTYNVTAETIARKITKRTKAIMVTHLFGNPCDMDPIMDLAAKKGLPVLEDCAQAYGTTYNGKHVGTIGAIGAFSLQQGKHMTTGEGGMVVTSDPAHERRMRLFIDKAWGYGDPNPDHYFLAMNYRMTELQGAVALAQLDKLDAMVAHRIAMADRLTAAIGDVRGVAVPKVTPGGRHTYWKYCIRVDPNKIKGGSVGFGDALKPLGVMSAPRYIQKLAFECEVLRDHRTFGKSEFPYVGPHRAGDPPVVYDKAEYPGSTEALADVVVLPWNEKYTTEHVDAIAAIIRKAAADLAIG